MSKYHWRTDHYWYRIRYAFWMMVKCSWRVTPAFAWDCATCWDWGGGMGEESPRDAVDTEVSYWDADEP